MSSNKVQRSINLGHTARLVLDINLSNENERVYRVLFSIYIAPDGISTNDPTFMNCDDMRKISIVAKELVAKHTKTNPENWKARFSTGLVTVRWSGK